MIAPPVINNSPESAQTSSAEPTIKIGSKAVAVPVGETLSTQTDWVIFTDLLFEWLQCRRQKKEEQKTELQNLQSRLSQWCLSFDPYIVVKADVKKRVDEDCANNNPDALELRKWLKLAEDILKEMHQLKESEPER